jgi:hypothetical protein
MITYKFINHLVTGIKITDEACFVARRLHTVGITVLLTENILALQDHIMY